VEALRVDHIHSAREWQRSAFAAVRGDEGTVAVVDCLVLFGITMRSDDGLRVCSTLKPSGGQAPPLAGTECPSLLLMSMINPIKLGSFAVKERDSK